MADLPLTTRQREVLKLLADGLRNREIAEKLGIALVTVRWHLKELHAKLGDLPGR